MEGLPHTLPPPPAQHHTHQQHLTAIPSHPIKRQSHSTSPEMSHHPSYSPSYSHVNSHPHSQLHPHSRPPSRGSTSVPFSHSVSVSELEAHYHELKKQRQTWEEMMHKTDRLMTGVQRALEEAREKEMERERDARPPSGGGRSAPSVPLPPRSTETRNGAKDVVWALTTNGTPSKER
jgi:hypothetical protein